MNKFVKSFAEWLQTISDNEAIFRAFPEKTYVANGSIIKEKSDGSVRSMEVVPLGSTPFSGKVNHELSKTQGVDWSYSIFVNGVAASSICSSPDSVASVYKKVRKSLLSNQNSGSLSYLLVKASVALVGMFFIFTYATSVSVGKQVSAVAAPTASSPMAKLALAPLPQGLQSTPAVQAVEAAAAAKVAIDPPPAEISKDSFITEQESKMLASQVGKSTFTIGTGSKTFYLFTDPNCPHCRRLESTIKQLPADAKAIVFPVSYQTGSKELVASILCAKDMNAAWREAVISGKALNPKCAAGEKHAAENNKIFESLRLTSTPSFVSPGGVFFSGYLTPEQLANLVKN